MLYREPSHRRYVSIPRTCAQRHRTRCLERCEGALHQGVAAVGAANSGAVELPCNVSRLGVGRCAEQWQVYTCTPACIHATRAMMHILLNSHMHAHGHLDLLGALMPECLFCALLWAECVHAVPDTQRFDRSCARLMTARSYTAHTCMYRHTRILFHASVCKDETIDAF